jgi:hypothetical protein
MNRKLQKLIWIVTMTIVFGFGQTVWAAPLHEAVADAYGIQSFGSVDQIRYTFNVKVGERRVKRSWVWEPHANRVTFDKDGKPFTYNRNELNNNPSEELKKIDARFINDQYWLLFPLHLVWDDKAKIEDTGGHKLPMGDGNAERLVVTYPPTGGYTPGDVYELFIDNNRRISQWIYRRGGSPKPTRVTTWEDYRAVGPLTICFNHKGSDGDFHLWFSDVAVKLKNSDHWVEVK